MAVCDSEAEYAGRMQEFLCMRDEIPFEVYAFTDVAKLESCSQKEEIEIFRNMRNFRDLLAFPLAFLSERNKACKEMNCLGHHRCSVIERE